MNPIYGIGFLLVVFIIVAYLIISVFDRSQGD